MRTYGLYGRSMWFDESMSWRTIQFPFAEMLVRTARNSHVPLFFVLLRLWTAAFGEGIVALRTFSLAFSALAMLGVYLFTVDAMAMVRSASDGPPGADSRARWIGLAATALFAVSLFQVRMAWEIRMYSLGTALAMFSAWLLVRALTARPPRRMLWMLYMLVGLLFAYTHYCASSRWPLKLCSRWSFSSPPRGGTSRRRSRTSVSAGSAWHTRAWLRAGPPGCRCSGAKAAGGRKLAP